MTVVKIDNVPKKLPNEAESNRHASEIRSSNPELQERSQHEENNVLADGNKNCDLADLLLSSKELPSWAMRQTAAVPPNTHRIAECQGCMKGHGALHTCDMKEEIPLRYPDVPPSSAYPISSNRHSMIPPPIMNPYAPAWSEGHEVCPPSWRRPSLPPWRQDQNSYHGRHGYENHYWEDCEDDYIRHYPLDVYGRHYMHEGTRGPHEGIRGSHEGTRGPHDEGIRGPHEGIRGPHEGTRGPQPHEAYIPHVNYSHNYGGTHDPAFFRPRHMEDHLPPPSHLHQYPARKYPHPHIPLSGQGLTGSEWQSRSQQNYSQYEPQPVSTDAFVDRINLRGGDWPQLEKEQSTLTYASHPGASSLSQSPLCTTRNQSDSQSDKLENYQSPSQSHSLAGDFSTKAAPISETKASNELEVISTAERKSDFSEKNRPAYPADDLKPCAISSSTFSNNNNKAITSNNDLADLIDLTTVSEATKTDEKASLTLTSNTDSTILVNVAKEEIQPSYTRKSPCAFTIDISPVGSSAADSSFSTPRLPANLAKRVAKFPRKPTPKEDKSEKAQQGNVTSSQEKRKSSLQPSKQLADDKDRKSSKVKHHQQPVSSNSTEDDDCDDDRSETYQERLQWSKSMVWTKVEANLLKNDHYFKTPESGLRGTSITTSRVKSKLQSDDSQNGKMNKSVEFERPSVHKDNSSISTRKYASFGHKSSNYQPEEIGHKASSETEDDTSSELSETETYTICTSEQEDRAVAAAREKIAEVFRVGMKDEMSDTEGISFVTKFIDEDEDISGSDNSLQAYQSENSHELENITELTTAEEVYQRKPEDVSGEKSQKDSGLNLVDSDDVICLTYDSNKDSVDGRKSKNDAEINSANSFPMSTHRRTSLSKRLLPRIPGKDADGTALVFEAADNRSDAGDSDKGFFEVLSCDAPPMRLSARKKAGHPELKSSNSGTYQKLRTDGEFEIIADAPREVEDAGLRKEKASNDYALDFFKRNKLLTNCLNNRDLSSLSQSEDEELKKIFYDDPRSIRVIDTTATDELGHVSDRKPKHHALTEKLHSTPRFYDTALPDETSSKHSQKPVVCNSIATSKRQNIFSRTSNEDRSTSSSANEGFVPLSFGRSSVRSSEGRKLPGSPTKPMNNTKSEFITRGRLGSGCRGPQDNPYGTSSLSQPSTPRLAQRMISNKMITDNAVDSRPPSSGSRQKTVVSKTVSSQGSAIVSEPGTPSRTPQTRQRSLSRPTFSRGDPQISLSRPPSSKDESQRSLTKPPLLRCDPPTSLSRSALSRDDPTRQQLKSLKHSSFDSSDTPESVLLNRSKQHQAFKGRRLGETPIPETATGFGNEGRMKRSKSASTSLRSRTSDAENPKLQAYHERMKYDPRKAIEDSKKQRLSASSRSDDTDASSYEELQSHHLTRHHPESMSLSDRHSRRTNDYQPRSSLKSGTRPRSARTRKPSDEKLNHSTSSDIDVAYGVRSTTIPSIQILSEDIQQLLDKIKQEKTRTQTTAQVTNLSANRPTSSVDDDPQLNELRKTLRKVKQVLQSKFHS